MAKKKVTRVTTEPACEHLRGIIQDNHLKALVTSPVPGPGRTEQERQGQLSAQGQARQAVGPGQQQMVRVCC